MSQIINLVGEMFIKLFGSPILVALIFIGFIIFMLLAANVGKSAIIMIIVPLIATITGAGISAYIKISGNYDWLIIALFMAMAVIFSTVFWFLTGN